MCFYIYNVIVYFFQFSSVQLLSRVRLFATPWTIAHQASLSITSSRSPPKPISLESVILSNHLILCVPFSSCPQSFPTSESFPVSQFFASGGQSIGVSASTSVLPMNIQGWFPLGLTGLTSMQSKGLSRVFSNTTVQKHQFFGAQLSWQSNSHIHTWPLEKPLTRWTFVDKVMSLLLNMLSRLVITCLPRMAAITTCSDFGAQKNKVSHCFHVSPSICHEVSFFIFPFCISCFPGVHQ